MSWWQAQAQQNAKPQTYTMFGTEFYTDTNQPVSQASRVQSPVATQDMGVGTGSTYIDPNGAIGQAIANAPKAPSNPIRSNSEINYNPLRFSDPGGNENIVITQESLPTIQAERPDVYEAITSQPQQEVSQPVISEPDLQTEDISLPEVTETATASLFSDSDEYKNLTARIDELEKQIAADSATEQTSTTTARSSNKSAAGKGIIPDIISKTSPLSDTSSLSVGGQVYGPDGTAYSSVTAAIQAGVFNFTYFPISTGIQTGGDITGKVKTPRRSFTQEAAQSSNDPANPLKRMFGG